MTAHPLARLLTRPGVAVEIAEELSEGGPLSAVGVLVAWAWLAAFALTSVVREGREPSALVTPEVPTAVDGVAVVLAGAVVGAVAHTLARLPIEVGSPRTLLLADGNTPTGVWINLVSRGTFYRWTHAGTRLEVRNLGWFADEVLRAAALAAGRV